MIGKLLCLVVFAGAASAALTTDVSIVIPAAGVNVTAGKDMLVQVQVQKATPTIEDVAIVVAADWCPPTVQCPSGLGRDILYNSSFHSQWTDSIGQEYENITVIAPDAFVGTMQVSVAYSYREPPNNDPEVATAKTIVNLTGATG